MKCIIPLYAQCTLQFDHLQLPQSWHPHLTMNQIQRTDFFFPQKNSVNQRHKKEKEKKHNEKQKSDTPLRLRVAGP